MLFLEPSRNADCFQYSALLQAYYSLSQISRKKLKNKLFITFINKLFIPQAFTLYKILHIILNFLFCSSPSSLFFPTQYYNFET